MLLSVARKDGWSQAVRVDLLNDRQSSQQESYKLSKHNTTNHLELAQQELELVRGFSQIFNQQILADLDDSTRELLKSCRIDVYLWAQNSFVRIYPPNSYIFNCLKKGKKWVRSIQKTLSKILGSVREVEVVYKENEKLNVFYRTLSI